MSIEAQSMDELYKMSYSGGNFFLRAGKGGAKAVAYLQAKIKAAENGKKSGLVDLSMLNEGGEELCFYYLRKEDFDKIAKAAKAFGLKYSVIMDSRTVDPNSEVTLFIRVCDASKVERILDDLQIGVIEPDLTRVEISAPNEHKVITTTVDFGDVSKEKKPEKKPVVEKEPKDPFTETPSGINYSESRLGENRKSVRAELERIEEKRKKKASEGVSIDKQLFDEFNSKSLDML